MNFFTENFKYENGASISGLTGELNIFYLLNLLKVSKKNILVVTSSLYEANKISNSLATYTSDYSIFPMDDFLSSMIVASSPELKFTRLETIDKISDKKQIVITNLMGYLKYLPSKESKSNILIKKNDVIKRDELVNSLVSLGYHRETLVTTTGEYAVRGFIVDVFLINESHPIRIEFDGNVIESIRYFSEDSQMSLKETDELLLKPVDEVLNGEFNSLLDYLGDTIVVFVDKNQIDASFLKLTEDIFQYKTNENINENLMFSLNEIKPKEFINLDTFEKSDKGFTYSSKELINYKEDMNRLKEDYLLWTSSGKKVFFCLTKEREIKIIKDLLPEAVIIKRNINKGFIFYDYVYISENDIEETKHEVTKYKKNYYVGKKIKDYNQLEIGDYVVHITHGIGVYNGIKTLTVKGMKKDFIEILFLGKDKIYVPVEKISTIYKYSGKDGSAPKLNSLSSNTWEKTKRYIESKIKDISRELIRLYKERINVVGVSYRDYEEEDIFGSTFSYELTKDQKKSINDINNDLKSSHPMDRLLCGDVGFGKTEVALRAIFKTVLNNYQVMYLCPTTILSKQQYLVAKERFKDWPIEIALLNRHVSGKDAKKILDDLKSGKIDIIFGTHRLLSEDVLFKRLGLLVVDEEQRFGVTHKEKIKTYKTDVNVLTLSATPIPRTLKMAMSGLRDLSIIDTPPVNRYPVQTYVIKEDDLIIKDAIYKELSRNGQIFILYNKVESIEKTMNHIKKLVPDAKVIFAHGKMDKNELDDIMIDFVDRKYDILICTTIIESGIDIPNVNTLIIYDANNFGLSQLYQIRGRVGRSNKIAYAYLLYKPNKILTEIAVKRLNTIKDFTELGSGYRIAMRDLSIRGSGDIFGASQAGFVDSIGLSLYMKMIEDEMKRQRGEEVVEETDIAFLINVETHISDEYTSDEDIKIEIHQKINEIDCYEKLLEIKNELEDRFGKISEEVLVYMYEEWFEKLALKYNITNVVQNERYIEIELPVNISREIKGDKLLFEAFSISKYFNIKYRNNKIIITLYYKELDKHFIFYIVKLLDSIL
ncbi:MAG: transcription-repair coupling factor [Bacilli bacterium]